MFAVIEKGLFLKPNYQLRAEYDELPDDERKEFLHHLEAWNCDPDRFLPEKVCAVFAEMNRLQVEKRGSLGRRECYLCSGIEGEYTEDSWVEYRLKGVPEKLAANISLIHGNHAAVLLDGIRHYVFMEEETASAWRSLRSYEIQPAGWLEECRKFLRRQAFSREHLAESFFGRRLPIYQIRPGFREDGEFLQPYYFGISLNGSMDNFFLTFEEYMDLYRKHYGDSIVTLDQKLCIVNFESNLSYLEKLYQNRKIPNSVRSLEILRNDKKYSLGEACRWVKRVYFSCDPDNKMAVVRENTGRMDPVVVLTRWERAENWRKYFPAAMVHTPESLVRDLEDGERKLEICPIVFVWDEPEMDWSSCSCYLKFLLRFCSVSQEFLFFSGENLPAEQDYEKMEEVFYVSGLKEGILKAKDRSEKCENIRKELLLYTEPGIPDENLESRIQAQEHILWLQKHLELYLIPEGMAELFGEFKEQKAEPAAVCEDRENWYQNFLLQCQNNMFMYKNGIHMDTGIWPSVFGAYFLPLGDTVIPLGFLQEADPDWKISQRRRIFQWMEDQREEWQTYLESSFAEFYLEGGEELRMKSEKQISSDLEILTEMLISGKGILETDSRSMYAGLNQIRDIL